MDQQYSPARVSHPGKVLWELLAGMSEEEVSKIGSYNMLLFFKIIAEKRSIDGLEWKLSEIFGTSEELWHNLQKQYNEWVKKHEHI